MRLTRENLDYLIKWAQSTYYDRETPPQELLDIPLMPITQFKPFEKGFRPNPNFKTRVHPAMYDAKTAALLDRYAAGVFNAEMQADRAYPWIRTRQATPLGSAAYGPYQLTPTKSNDYFDRFASSFTPDEHNWHNDYFRNQSKQALRLGRNPHLPDYLRRYDYGGIGIIGNTLQSRQHYLNAARKMMLIDLYNNQGDFYKALNVWKGDKVPLSRDSEYFKRFQKGLADYDARQKQLALQRQAALQKQVAQRRQLAGR